HLKFGFGQFHFLLCSTSLFVHVLIPCAGDDIDRVAGWVGRKGQKFGSCRWRLRCLADPADFFFSPSTPTLPRGEREGRLNQPHGRNAYGSAAVPVMFD